MESNRGQISPFEIVRTEYYDGKKNFLRAHTCFNRLDLPNFPDKEKLKHKNISFNTYSIPNPKTSFSKANLTASSRLYLSGYSGKSNLLKQVCTLKKFFEPAI